MLPNRKMFGKIFPESFIYFKPKDIVSGDFYWFGKSGSKLIVAIVDCTGHGVPGAFMSMIGYNLLNAHTVKEDTQDPSKLLQKLNEGVNFILNQDGGDNISNDGMDMAICMIDKETRTIEFAGANRPLVFFNKGEMIIAEGEKYGIGGIQATESKHFTNHVFNYQEGDTFYMFTDGFSDQFGGPDNRKMMKKNLYRLINSIQSSDMVTQEDTLRHAFKEWRGTNEQTDDVLLMGIKLTG
jgi:serine phosphatase RsbU (regulator of sigma subunit)